MTSKVLVVGGLGYLGSIVSDLLYKQKDETDICDICLWKNREVGKLISFNTLYSSMECVKKTYDKMVWCADIDIPEFWNINSEIINLYKNKIINYFDFSPIKDVLWIQPYFPSDYKNNSNRYDKMEEYVGALNSIIYKNRTVNKIGFASFYGPSPRMRWDTVVNSIFLSFLTQRAVIIDNPLSRVRLISILDAAHHVVETLKSPVMQIPYFYTEEYSIIELAHLIKYLLGNGYEDCKILMNKYENDETVFRGSWQKEKSKHCDLEKAIKEMRDQLEKNMFPDFADDRYNNNVCVSAFASGLALIEGLKQ